MLYNNFTITISQRQEARYQVSAVADGIGRVSALLAPPDLRLKALLAEAARTPAPADGEATLRAAGEVLFRWLLPSEMDTHLRIAWDRADHLGRGLRLRLSIDAPEIAVFPWELLRDPVRDHLFATAVSSLLVRYLDQAAHFGPLADLQTDLPLNLLLVVPCMPDIDQNIESTVLAQAAAKLGRSLKVRSLDGDVTRADLADRLVAGRYDVLHFSGHGGFNDGQGFIALNVGAGKPDWVDGQALAWLVGNHKSLKLVVLNGCSTGQVSDGLAFRGLAPQLVRRGIPAVVAMQHSLSNQAAGTFAREFYRQLCQGENAGQVDVALTHARSMLAVLFPGDRSWAAPVLYTHAAEGVIFLPPPAKPVTAKGGASPTAPADRVATFVRSLQASMDFDEDWALANPAQLTEWREALAQTADAYRAHLDHAEPDVRQSARYGLALVSARLSALDRALATDAKLTQQPDLSRRPADH